MRLQTHAAHTWTCAPLLPPSSLIPTYLYTFIPGHGRTASCREREREREIHASLNNPWPTLIRIFTRRNNIRPTIPADSPAIFYVRIIPTLCLPPRLSLQLTDPYRFSILLLPPSTVIPLVYMYSSRQPTNFSFFFISSLSLSLSFFPLLLLLHTRLAVAYHANARDHVLFMPYLRPLSLGNPTIFGYYLEILIRDGNYVGF